MAADLSRCPAPDVLEGLLAERLSGAERDGVETHVEDCVPCQEHLERLSNRVLYPSRALAEHRDEADLQPDEAFLRRLRGVPPPGVSRCSSPLPSWPGQPPAPVGRVAHVAWFEHGRLGRYEILGRLGEGGMGTVFKARHVELGKVVAVKVLPADQMDEVRVARFKNEIRAIGQLSHPNIVAAHDAGEWRGVHFLVMDFVEGIDLGRALERHGRLTVADACAVVHQAARGLQHAFERGLVHRDIKPSNLMLARDGRVQILDLGLARSVVDAAADTLTARGMLLGTADYLAPEQWEHAHAVDTRADIYGLGCTLYHLLAGRPPFTGERYHTVLQKMRAHLEMPPPPIERFCPEVPAALSALLDRMLAKDSADRLQTPAEVAEALLPFTTGSDLCRLLEEDRVATVSVGGLASAAPTPTPGQWETASEREDRGRRAPVAPRRRVLPMALAASLGLLLAVVSLFWPNRKDSSPSSSPLTITAMQVRHSRGKGTIPLGDLRTSPEPVVLEDDVEISAQLSASAYHYLIAFNPDGSEQLCSPEGGDGQGAPGAQPAAGEKVCYPQGKHVFILDTAGLQVFVLVASKRALPAYRKWRSQVDEIPWKGVRDGGAWRWHFDGHTFLRYPQQRGRVEAKEPVPEPLQQLGDFFRNRPEFDAVQLFAFPVAGKQG